MTSLQQTNHTRASDWLNRGIKLLDEGREDEAREALSYAAEWLAEVASPIYAAPIDVVYEEGLVS